MSSSAQLRTLAERLLSYGGPGDDPSPRQGGFLASVALVLRTVNGSHSPELLLIKRAESEGDPWSGHMALPGGRREEGDRSLLETARRETLEETGIVLEERGTMLGRLAIVSPDTPHLPPLSILPFVFGVPHDTRARTASAEVAEVHWVPLTHLLDPAIRTTHRLPAGEAELRFPALRVADRTVWGLTHRILSDLLTRIR